MIHESIEDARPEKVQELSFQISNVLNEDLVALRTVNQTTRLLSINARIEAASAGGTAGAVFSVIANEVMELSKLMDFSFNNIETKTTPLLKDIQVVGERLASDVRGKRLADLAAGHLDVIDRNLYERSCDVRWWATDSGLLKAANSLDPTDILYASSRMATILSSYTVYFDLVICGVNGTVITNGNTRKFASAGKNVKNQPWFKSALATRSSEEFGFQNVHRSELASNERVLIYSAAMRKEGAVNGDIIGVLGVIFRWDALGQLIVENAALSKEEADRSIVLILDEKGTALASNPIKHHNVDFPVSDWTKKSTLQRYHFVDTWSGSDHIIAVAQSVGYETYRTGWVSAIIQKKMT